MSRGSLPRRIRWRRLPRRTTTSSARARARQKARGCRERKARARRQVGGRQAGVHPAEQRAGSARPKSPAALQGTTDENQKQRAEDARKLVDDYEKDGDEDMPLTTQTDQVRRSMDMETVGPTAWMNETEARIQRAVRRAKDRRAAPAPRCRAGSEAKVMAGVRSIRKPACRFLTRRPIRQRWGPLSPPTRSAGSVRPAPQPCAGLNQPAFRRAFGASPRGAHARASS